MNTYETSSKVEGRGDLYITGVPFAPGTEVQVTIIAKEQTDVPTSAPDDALSAARQRMGELFQTVKGFRNASAIPREELYERGSLR